MEVEEKPRPAPVRITPPPVVIPHGIPVEVPHKPPIDSARPTLLQIAMSDSYSCGWVHDLLNREYF